MSLVDRYRRAKAPVRPFVRRHWRNPLFAGTASLARRYLAIYENGTHDLLVNGEAEVVRRLAPGTLRVAIDVGGFEGEWTALVRREQPGCAVHTFEPSPTVAELLAQRFAGDDLVIVNRCALGHESGEATLHVDRAAPSKTSLVPSLADTRPVAVRVARGDDYLAEQGIEHVGFLKIDAEGHDLRVLEGFSDTLRAARITALQFEYNVWNVTSRALLADFYDLLEPLGYRIGKVHPDGVDYRPYDLALENWVGPACVAVHRDHPDVLAATSVDGGADA